jgi:hypothetical protein
LMFQKIRPLSKDYDKLLKKQKYNYRNQLKLKSTYLF